MKTHKPGTKLYATHHIIGTEVGTGTEVTVVNIFRQRKYETRYEVRTPGGFYVYCYASDLSETNPLGGSHV